LKIGIGIVIGLVVIGMVLVFTGGLDYAISFLYGDNTGLMVNGFLVLVIIGAIFAVIFGGKKDEDSSSSSK